MVCNTFLCQHHNNGNGSKFLQPTTILIALLVLVSAWSLYYGWNPVTLHHAHPLFDGLFSDRKQSDPPVFLRQLYGPIKPSITQHSYTVVNGKNYTISGTASWKEPLRKQVLILDMDTRSLHGEAQILNDGPVSWSDMEQRSSGLLNHYMYSLIHDYDYKLIRPEPFPDRFATWVKPSIIADALREYRFVVFTDSDALWNQPEVPLEWLLNHWNITQDTSLAIALDGPRYVDSHGRNGVNTGFIVAQQSERTQQILASWSSCPSGEHFPGCETWANRRVFEQTAFNEYIRYAFNETEDIKELSCDETDGYPEDARYCDGVFIRHFWSDKNRIKEAVTDIMMRPITQQLHAYFLKHREDLVEEHGS